MKSQPFTLLDGEVQSALYPATFSVAINSAKASLLPGDYVKLCFIGTDGVSERMWVLITSMTDDGILTGTLDNDPIYLSIVCGVKVDFERRHVLNIMSQVVPAASKLH